MNPNMRVKHHNDALDEIIGKTFPVLDKGFVRLVDYMGTDASIVQAARVSYGAGSKSIREDSGLISYLMLHAHSSPFEQCSLKFHIKLPVFVCRQFVRHRTAKMNEMSARYSKIEDEFWMPESWRSQSKENKQGSEQKLLEYPFVNTAEDHAFLEYNNRIDYGIAREQARSCLPVSMYTQMYWKMDLRNLLHFLKLRCDNHAQKETRDYANAIASIVEIGYPITWTHFQNHVMNAKTFSADEMKLLPVFYCMAGNGFDDEEINDRFEAVLGESRARELWEKLDHEPNLS